MSEPTQDPEINEAVREAFRQYTYWMERQEELGGIGPVLLHAVSPVRAILNDVLEQDRATGLMMVAAITKDLQLLVEQTDKKQEDPKSGGDTKS